MFHLTNLFMHHKFVSLLTLLAATLLILVGCKQDQDEPEPIEPTDMNIVTGIYLINEVGAQVGEYGNPNERKVSSNALHYARAFPVPARNRLSVELQIDSIDSEVKVWLIPGKQNLDFADTNFAKALSDHTYDQKDLTQAAVIDQSFASADGYPAIDVSKLTPGFYRMFVHIEQGDLLFWQNIYIPRPNSSWDDFTAIFEAWE